MCAVRTSTRSVHGCKRGTSSTQSRTCGSRLLNTTDAESNYISRCVSGGIPLKKLTGRDLQWLYKDLQEHGRLREAQKGRQPGLSDSTIRGIHTLLHNALARAVKERLIVRNPADDCVPPKIPKHEMKILPPEQIKSYLTAADQRGVLPMFYLELISGLRKGELVALQWSDLDIENKTISVSKQAG
jgi:integrase